MRQKMGTCEASSARDLEIATPLAPSGDMLPELSPFQEYYLSPDRKGAAADNLVMAFRLSGRLDVAALDEAIRQLVARHVLLRTRFQVDRSGQTRPFTCSPAAVTVDVRDEPGLSQAERAECAAHWFYLIEESLLDLFVDVPCRCMRLGFSRDDHALILSVHHVAADGWSLRVLLRDLAELYKANVERRSSNLPALTGEFSEYAAWHKGHLRAGQFAAAAAYWRQQLAGVPIGLALAESKVRSPDGLEHLHFAVDAATTSLLHAACRTLRVTSFMALLAALQFSLAHLSRRDDIAIYTLLANRVYPGSENLAGPFMNPTVIRSQVGRVATFTGLLEEMREVLVAGLHYQDAPYWLLRRRVSELERIHNAPLPQAVFNLSQGPLDMDLAPHLVCTNIRLPGRRMRTGLRLDIAAGASGGLAGHLQFKPGVFAQETVAAIARLLTKVLEVVARQPAVELSRLGAL